MLKDLGDRMPANGGPWLPFAIGMNTGTEEAKQRLHVLAGRRLGALS